MPTDMRGVSAESLPAVVRRLDEVVDTGADAGQVGADLFAVAALLDAQPGLRRVLTDPSRSGHDQAELLRRLLADRVVDATAEVAAVAAERRWSRGRDLANALEHVGVVAQVVSAEHEGQADELEDELFRFGRLVAAHRGLRDVLTDRTVLASRKAELVGSLLGDRATPATVRLAQQATAGRHRSFAVALQEYQQVAADRRQRMVATVRVAKPLSEDDNRRLREALRRQYNQPVHLNVVVDDEVLGGLRVEIGDDVIDGTVASRLDEARRRLAG
ncbi:MAG: F0F1 ATP synthase subunit delta [Kribbellaceae bacterium]